MASKDLSKAKMVPNAKTITSSSSSVAPRKYGAHAGLKFKINFDKNSIKKSTFNVENRTEKKPPLPEDEEHPGLKINLEGESKKKSASNQSKIEKQKQPPTEDEGHLVQKIKLQRDSKKNSATSASKIEKEKPLSAEDGHSGLIIKLEKDSKKSAILERKTNKEKAPLPECEGHAGLKTNLEGNSKKKSATNQSKIEKGKQPPRKYGAHCGLKFNINIEKHVIPKTFIFEGSTADTKRYSDAKKIGTIPMQTFKSQTHKELLPNPGVEKHASTMQEREKTLRESESFYDVIVEENVQDDFEILSKKEIAKLCSNFVASSRDLKHQHKSPKVTKSHADDTLKPPEIAPTASNLSSLNVPQISKGRPTIEKEPPIPRYSHATTVRTITRQIVESEAHKEELHKSGVKKYASTFEEDKESSGESQSFYEVIVDENVQDGCEILSKKEIAVLCSNSVASFRDLKHQHKSPQITNSRACSTLKPTEIAPEASNLSSLNVLQTSKGRLPVAKVPPVPRHLDVSKFVTIAMPVDEYQTHKEERHKSGVKKYETNLEEDEKTTLDESEFFYDVIVEENMQDNFEILPKKEMAKLRSKSIVFSRDLKHQHKSSKITNSLAYDALKPPEIALKASNFSSWNIPQISEGCPPVSKESKVYETRFSDAKGGVCTIAMKVADNQMHKEERHKSGVKKYESDLEEEDVQTFPDIESFYEAIEENVQDYYEIKPSDATMQTDDFVPIKRKCPKSDKGKHFSIQKDDFKLGGQSGQNSISMKSVQEDTKISIENESEDLCNRIATSLRVLQPQLRALKISESQVSDRSKPQAIVCKTSKLPMLNVPQTSRGQPTKLEEPMILASQRKYGLHAGLRFPFKPKKAIPVDINFNRTPSLQKDDKCFKNEKRDPAS